MQIKIFTRSLESFEECNYQRRSDLLLENNINSWIQENPQLTIIDIKPFGNNSIIVVWSKN